MENIQSRELAHLRGNKMESIWNNNGLLFSYLNFADEEMKF